MKILITGSSGMLGTELCGVLGAEHEIGGIDLVAPSVQCSMSDVFYEADITDAGKIKGIFDKERPDLVIHAAAWTDVDGCEKDPEKAYAVNAEGTKSIVKAAAGEGIPVVLVSTDFVFDGEKQSPYTEEDAAKPLSVYGKTKWEAEEAVKNGLSRYAVVRTSWLFGRNGKNFVNTIIEKSRTEKKLRIVNDQVGSPTYAKDLARALERLIETVGVPGKEMFHVSNSGQCSWFDFAREILSDVKETAGVKVEPVTSSELARPAPRPGFSVLDNSKFQKTTEYEMRSWEDALKEYVDNECL